MKHEALSAEIALIKDETLRQTVRDYFDNAVHDYFYTIAASTTGKYHPEIDLGVGGLVRHTQMCVRVAQELLNLTMFSKIEHDIVISALLIHDSQKCGDGKSQYSLHEHPALAADAFMRFAASTKVPVPTINAICKCVRSHMGQWNKNPYSKAELPLPCDKNEKFVHLCDYIASRKFIGNL